MAIRYDKQLKNEIYKAVRAFNAKVTRLEKKGVSAALLPDRISTKSIKANFDTRRTLRTHLKALQEFTSKGQTYKSEGGVTGTTALFQYTTKRANKAVTSLKRELKNLGEMKTSYPMMKSDSMRTLEAKINYLQRDIYKLDIRQVNAFITNTEITSKAREKNAIFYKNFKQMLFQVAYREDIDVTEISDLIEELPPEKLLELYRTEPSFKNITEKYEAYKDKDVASAPASEAEESYAAMKNVLKSEIAKQKG